MKTNFKLILFISILFILGCNPNAIEEKTIDLNNELNKVSDSITESNSNLDESTKKISEKAVSINQTTTVVKTKIPIEHEAQPLLDGIESDANDIIVEVGNLSNISNEIKKASSNLSKTKADAKEITSYINNLESNVDTLSKENEKLIADKRSQREKMLNWIIVASIVGAGVFGALILFGNVWAISGVAACALTMTLAITVTEYLQWIAMGGLAVIFLAVAMVLYQIFKQRKAISEMVKTVELTKVELPKDSKDRIFGRKNEEGLVHSVQSKSTSRMVSQQKKKFDALWKIAKQNKKNFFN